MLQTLYTEDFAEMLNTGLIQLFPHNTRECSSCRLTGRVAPPRALNCRLYLTTTTRVHRQYDTELSNLDTVLTHYNIPDVHIFRVLRWTFP